MSPRHYQYDDALTASSADTAAEALGRVDPDEEDDFGPIPDLLREANLTWQERVAVVMMSLPTRQRYIALALDVSIPTVKRRVKTAKEKLRRVVES